MHQVAESVDAAGHYLVHTTNLKDHRIVNLNTKLIKRSSLISGPAVLLPRVGVPKMEKIVMVSPDESYVISDCILAILTKSVSQAQEVIQLIRDNWSLFLSMYTGTGAKYTTISKLRHFLHVINERNIIAYKSQCNSTRQQTNLVSLAN